MYRSKDPDIRSRIKKDILKAMRGFKPDAKQEGWTLALNYLRLDDLQQWAIEQKGEIIELGEGPVDAKIVWVTPDPCPFDLNTSWVKSLDFPWYEIYRTSFWKGLSHDDDLSFFQEVLISEILCLSPLVVLYQGLDREWDEIQRYLDSYQDLWIVSLQNDSDFVYDKLKQIMIDM